MLTIIAGADLQVFIQSSPKKSSVNYVNPLYYEKSDSFFNFGYLKVLLADHIEPFNNASMWKVF